MLAIAPGAHQVKGNQLAQQNGTLTCHYILPNPATTFLFLQQRLSMNVDSYHTNEPSMAKVPTFADFWKHVC